MLKTNGTLPVKEGGGGGITAPFSNAVVNSLGFPRNTFKKNILIVIRCVNNKF